MQTLRATALRAGDVSTLKRTDVLLAKQSGGHMRLDVAKTGQTSHIVLEDAVLTSIDIYLKERSVVSPWILIQQGRTGDPPQGKPWFLSLSPAQVRVWCLAQPGLDPFPGCGSGGACWIWSFPGAPVHLHRSTLGSETDDSGVSIDQVQTIHGARAQTTNEMFASESNIPEVQGWEQNTQRGRSSAKEGRHT
ncbi:MAG: hypothetical protein JXA25_13420 [Anaerolineales bacterium]|nr:hypothetical protein [Anaerolineales bacterium]